MSADKSKHGSDSKKSSASGNQPANEGPVKSAPIAPAPKGPPAKQPPAKPLPAALPPLYRRVDWVTFWFTTLFTFIGYYLTLAPDLTLQDSGELAVGSFYCGVPHPPGYPLWTIYTWLFTQLIPFSNIAWRVALSSAVASALACGLIALMVSRGSSMMMEGIAELKNIDRRLENLLCVVAGFVSGTLLAFNGRMWSQAVIVEVYPFSLLSFVGVLLCLLRWMYAPNQLRYLYGALLIFGISITNHQTLIVAAMGIEVLILMANPKLGRDCFAFNSICFLLGLFLKAKGIITTFDSLDPSKPSMLYLIFIFVGLGSMAISLWMIIKTKGLFSEWLPLTIMAAMFLCGAAFYFYMPIASMTNPPMNWGYPRTWEGFLHALSRGQYEKTNPTDIFGDPKRFIAQLEMYLQGAVDEYSLVFIAVGLVPFFYYARMQKREQGLLKGSAAMFLCLSGLLMILLNPTPDRQTKGLTKVFFAASDVFISMAIGYGLTLICATVATNYERIRTWLLYSGAVAVAIAFYAVVVIFQTDKTIDPNETVWLGLLPSQDPLVRFTAIFSLILVVAATALVLIFRNKGPVLPLLVLFAISPARSMIAHWAENEQRGHMFGYWFGHDMFTPPFGIYPEMARNAVLFGGTDPGRFCPTYMIFCESFIPPRCKPHDPKFDRRDVYLITQNALADGTYLEYIRAHYNRSEQKDPPFFQEMVRAITDGLTGGKEREKNYYTNLLARAVSPLDRLFTDLGAKIEARRRADGVYPVVDAGSPLGRLLEENEKLKTNYIGRPPTQPALPRDEIHTPSVEESQRAFQDYMQDAARRRMLNQLKPGEEVREDRASGRVSVSGQVAVMQINGLLTKVIFDANPLREFYVEESFPLDWMYPHLTPSGIIMKINRQPLASLSEEVLKKDHDFWSQYSGRFIGNWVTYDTPVSNICAFAEKTFLRRDLEGFKGDPRFVRDDDAQKAFSKLRSSIAGVYSWRLGPECPAAFRPKTSEEQQRVLKEADFAYRQALAFCPYSPEAVFRYVNLLASMQRYDDAERVAATCLKFDPLNTSVANLVEQLKRIRGNKVGLDQVRGALAQFEEKFRTNPGDVTNSLVLFDAYLQVQQTNRAIQVLETLAAQPQLDVPTLVSIANEYAKLGYAAGLENILIRVTKQVPENPEAWYDLASIQATLGKKSEALATLALALDLNRKRRATEPSAKDLAAVAAGIEPNRSDPFKDLRGMPEFKKLVSAK
ncbi:MAG: DUF2723 domain-containing protein [Verrucomicrobia bacterium]|nr:DUF2723 domain-containing protein [Verrucomicrobiota bacterium]